MDKKTAINILDTALTSLEKIESHFVLRKMFDTAKCVRHMIDAGLEFQMITARSKKLTSVQALALALYLFSVLNIQKSASLYLVLNKYV